MIAQRGIFLVLAFLLPFAHSAAQPHLLHVQGNVWMVHTPEANMTVQAGDGGLLLVDTLTDDTAEAVYEMIRPLSPKPIQHIINTHAHADFTGANAQFAVLGRSAFGGNVAGVVNSEILDQRAKIYAHENALLAMSADEPAREFADWPTDVFHNELRELFFNDEGVQIFHQPNAHTTGDSIVFFRRSDVISTGDLFRSHEFPQIEEGGSIAGVIDALNAMLDLALPGPFQEGGTMIIPGRGRLCDEADLLEYRDMVVIVRDRIQHMIDEGQSLRAVQAAQPTLGYDWQYGRSNDNYTSADFVEAVWRDLTRQ